MKKFLFVIIITLLYLSCKSEKEDVDIIGTWRYVMMPDIMMMAKDTVDLMFSIDGQLYYVRNGKPDDFSRRWSIKNSDNNLFLYLDYTIHDVYNQQWIPIAFENDTMVLTYNNWKKYKLIRINRKKIPDFDFFDVIK